MAEAILKWESRAKNFVLLELAADANITALRPQRNLRQWEWSLLSLFQGGTPHAVKRQIEDIEISQAACFRHAQILAGERP